ncbi:DUF2058 domain-containing protein [Dokdonella sp.]|uniref:DUF2058 domain-containing protein n=1 Tax=Dokdonella sp. TaxID=2291710 RepID=UPI003C589428
MADSLRDQLLKSGLVQKLRSEARPAERPARPARTENKGCPSASRPPKGKSGRNGNAGEIDLARAYGLRDRAEREQKDLEKKQAEQRAREKAERKQKLAALLSDKALNKQDAEIPRHFPHGEKIRRVYCTAEQLAEVNSGSLAVVQYRGRYLLVSREIGLKAGEISPEALILLCDPDAAAEDDVPADLVW